MNLRNTLRLIYRMVITIIANRGTMVGNYELVLRKIKEEKPEPNFIVVNFND